MSAPSVSTSRTRTARKATNLCAETLRALWHEQVSDAERRALQPTASPEIQPSAHAADEAVKWAEEHLFEPALCRREHELWRHALAAAEAVRFRLLSFTAQRRPALSSSALETSLAHREALAREWAIVEAARDVSDGTQLLAPRAIADRSSRRINAPRSIRSLAPPASSRSFVVEPATGKKLRSPGAFRMPSMKQRGLPSFLPRSGSRSSDLDRDGLKRTQTVSECLQRGQLPQEPWLSWTKRDSSGGAVARPRALGESKWRPAHSLRRHRQHGPVEASDALRAIERYSGVRAPT
jgi:hypothetical protein